jgi:metal-dependent amidase/aminoacylase/carboxypeptidase family protein
MGSSEVTLPSTSPFIAILAKSRPDLGPYEDLYRHCHANGEFSTLEKETAALITKRLQALSADLDIRTGIGGHGQIAILKNGPGKTVLLRADIDALPVVEKTGLPYASTKEMRDTDGVVKRVMHGLFSSL